MSAAAPGESDDAQFSVRSQLRALADTWRALADVRLGIFAVETRRAGTAFATVLACAVAAACVLAASWVLVVGYALWWAIARGTEPVVAVGGALLVNVVVAMLLVSTARSASHRIGFAHTRQALQGPRSAT